MLTPVSAVVALSLALSAQAPVRTPPAPASAARPQAPGERELPTYYFLLGRFLEGEGKVDEAAAALRKAGELDPKSAEPRAELAALYARADRAPEALAAAEEAIKIDPKNREANRILGTVLASFAAQRQAAKPGDDVSSYGARAMAALEIARGDGTGDLSIDLTLARLYLERDRPADAIPLLRRIVAEQPQFAEGSVLLAEAQEQTGSPDAAIETLTLLLQDQPQFFRGRVQIAELYDRQRQWNEAAQAWAAVQKLSPRNTEVMARRATSLMNGGRPADAQAVLREALKIAPNDVRLTFILAQAHRDAGDLDAAEATARALAAAYPQDPRTTYLLAQMLDARGRHKEIVELLKPEIERLRAAKAKPQQIGLLLGAQGLALLQLKRYDEAIASYKEAIAATPDDTSVQFQFGAALDRAGRRPEAQKVFRDLIARHPDHANALNYLGYMLAEQGTSLDEAVSLIQRALALDPGNPSYLDSLGWAYFQQGKLDLADPPLSAAADRLPKNSVIQDHLGDLRLKQNRRAEAVEAWRRALAGDGDGIDRLKVQKKVDAAQRK
ncbi:MAG TPA: tetratricopeptide repeat protein [Vicinamibacterales bacterium]|nr:tetratricopeptide repeat protein [Vicinamibacterales bacterium]